MLRFPLFAHASARGTDKHKTFRDELASNMNLSSHVARKHHHLRACAFVHASQHEHVLQDNVHAVSVRMRA